MSIWGFDCDEILADFVGPYLEMVNDHFGAQLTAEDLADYYVEKTLGVDRSEVQVVLNEAWKSENLINIPAYPEGITALNKIKEAGHEIHIITSRGPEIRDTTKRWLKKHGVKYDTLTLTGHTNKYEPAQKLKLDYFVEDNPRHANSVAELGVSVFVPEYPWNRHKEMHENATRIKSCSGIFNHVNINA